VYRGRSRDAALRRHLATMGVAFDHFDSGPFSVYVLQRRVAPAQLASVWRLPSP
jgi:hypothetical protein